MKQSTKECNQCGAEYVYQASGWGCGDNYNHDRYCPDCWKLISKFLETIPRRFEYRQVGTDEVTLAQLLRWEHKAKRSSTLMGTCVAPGLMDMSTGDSQYVRMIVGRGNGEHRDVKFWLSEWKLSPEYTITKELYWDIEKDEPVNGEYYREIHTKINPAKHYPPKKPKSEQEIQVMPITGPLGLTYALKYLYTPDVDNTMLDTADEIGTNQIAIQTGYGEGKRTLDSLSEDEFSDVRQIIYDRYNPMTAPAVWPKLYLQCEKVFCRKELNRFDHVKKHGNRFSKLLATARVAKARYSWYKQYYQTFKENA